MYKGGGVPEGIRHVWPALPVRGEVYRRARARGCNHPHAIRVLGRAWLRVIWRMWHDGVPYDPDKHGNLRRLKAAGG